MTLNSRDDINQIIQNIGRQEGIETIHIYNKAGEIKFSNIESAVYQQTNIKDEACDICHKSDPPLVYIGLDQRTRIFDSPAGYRLLGMLTPIYNEKGCATDACHVHPEDKKILGALDVVVSLEVPDKAIAGAKNAVIGLAVIGFIVMSAIIIFFVHQFITIPIKKLIKGTEQIAGGDYNSKVDIGHQDEMEQLAEAINRMGDQIHIHQAELNEQRDEYRTLFDDAPCMISVHNRDFRLLRYNRQFMESFDPKPGSYCYQAYKGRAEKCDNCPVEKTFHDGKSHYGEMSAIGRDGTRHHWIFITSPLAFFKGEVIKIQSCLVPSLPIPDISP
jgi:histidine kinase